MDSGIVKDVKKIAILRANALGDFIVILPAVEAIRHAYPQAEIVLLGKELHKDFLKEKRTDIDRVIVIPVTKGLREEKGKTQDENEIRQFFGEIRKEEFDIIINFHGKGIAANPFMKNTGAKLTVGLTCPEAEPIDRSADFYYYQPEVIRYMEVASLIGAKPQSLEPTIKVLDQDRQEAKQFLHHEGINRRYVVLHPQGTDRRRMWPSDNFSKLGDLIQENGFDVIITGSAADNEEVSKITGAMKHAAVNACGKLSLGGLTGLFAGSSLTVAIDTGPLHLARAAGAPTVGIYWAPNVINWAPLTRQRHRPVISWQLHCPHCGIIPNDPYPYEPETEHCKHDFSSVQDITPEQVFAKAMELLCK